MKRLITSLSLLLSAALAPAPAAAGQADYGMAVRLIISQANVAFFNSTGTRTNPASCAGPGLQNRWAISLTTDAGKAILAAVMTAQARGKQVWINGTGTCSIWPDTESVDYIIIED